MYQHRFSQSEQNYNERNFTVRACVAFSFRWIWRFKNKRFYPCCYNSRRSRDKFIPWSYHPINHKRRNKKTRAKLYTGRTGELIAKFLAEANYEEPIGYTAVWTLLGQRYMGTEHYAKVRHFEGYYLGKKNFGCPLIMPGKWAMQGFSTTDYSTEDVPSYECYIPYSGCHDDNDCHCGPGVHCQCHGETCFKDETTTLDTGEQRLWLHNWTRDGIGKVVNCVPSLAAAIMEIGSNGEPSGSKIKIQWKDASCHASQNEVCIEKCSLCP